MTKHDTLQGREPEKENDLFFVCSLIEYIARKTKNKRYIIVNKIGKKLMEHIYELADVYHCENIDKITDDIIEKSDITNGNFDNVGDCKYAVPTHWDIGKVYKRLILSVKNNNETIIEALFRVYNTRICEKIDDYNCSAYYENPSYLEESFKAGYMLP